jgi:Methyltransferase FkbM domain
MAVPSTAFTVHGQRRTTTTSSTTTRNRHAVERLIVYFVKKCVGFVGVFCIGIMVGSQLKIKSDVGSLLLLSLTPPPTADGSYDGPMAPSNTNSINDKGWQTLNVYYGSTDLKEKSLPPEQRFFSQARQDECVLSLLNNRIGGYFVDLASNDATILSNTYSLELHFNWTGLCIEPNPIYWYNLTHYRPRCTIVGAVLGTTTGRVIDFLYDGNEHGGIVGDGFDNSRPALKHKSVQEYTITLRDVLKKNNAPRVIDYLSLDVEGAEEFIMNNFSFDEYTFKILTIERPKEGLKAILEKNQYKQIQRLSRWGETLWIHSSWETSLDLSRLDEFSGKRQWEEQKKRDLQFTE